MNDDMWLKMSPQKYCVADWFTVGDRICASCLLPQAVKQRTDKENGECAIRTAPMEGMDNLTSKRKHELWHLDHETKHQNQQTETFERGINVACDRNCHRGAKSLIFTGLYSTHSWQPDFHLPHTFVTAHAEGRGFPFIWAWIDDFEWTDQHLLRFSFKPRCNKNRAVVELMHGA